MSPRVVPRDDAAAMNRAQRKHRPQRVSEATLDQTLRRSERIERTATSYELYQRAEMLETRGAQVDYDALLTSGKGVEAIAFWKYATAPRGPDGSRMMDARETRTLSKASGPAGSYLVPQDFYDRIVSARRAAGVLGRDDVSLVLETEKGTTFPIPAASAHGVGAWTAESAAYPTGSQD